jgi:hypothetical protein
MENIYRTMVGKRNVSTFYRKWGLRRISSFESLKLAIGIQKLHSIRRG